MKGNALNNRDFFRKKKREEKQGEEQTETEGGTQTDTEREKKTWKTEERTKWVGRRRWRKCGSGVGGTDMCVCGGTARAAQSLGRHGT